MLCQSDRSPLFLGNDNKRMTDTWASHTIQPDVHLAYVTDVLRGPVDMLCKKIISAIIILRNLENIIFTSLETHSKPTSLTKNSLFRVFVPPDPTLTTTPTQISLPSRSFSIHSDHSWHTKIAHVFLFLPTWPSVAHAQFSLPCLCSFSPDGDDTSHTNIFSAFVFVPAWLYPHFTQNIYTRICVFPRSTLAILNKNIYSLCLCSSALHNGTTSRTKLSFTVVFFPLDTDDTS